MLVPRWNAAIQLHHGVLPDRETDLPHLVALSCVVPARQQVESAAKSDAEQKKAGDVGYQRSKQGLDVEYELQQEKENDQLSEKECDGSKDFHDGSRLMGSFPPASIGFYL
jgi:hypothetical protein